MREKRPLYPHKETGDAIMAMAKYRGLHTPEYIDRIFYRSESKEDIAEANRFYREHLQKLAEKRKLKNP